MDYTYLRPRFLRDGVPTRLGGIATNLARIASFSRQAVNRDAVQQMIIQSQLLIEWTMPDAQENADVLSKLDAQLSAWRNSWAELWENAEERQFMIEQSRAWSKRIPDASGLLG